MSYVILLRNPGNGSVRGIVESGERSDRLKTFPTKAAAQKLADDHAACKAWPYRIVEAP